MTPRGFIQGFLETGQFWFDVLPRLYYQPLPWIGLERSRRGTGTQERWAVIHDSLKNRAVTSAVDIGCNVGFFCFSLAFAGIPTLGVDIDERALRIARYTARKTKISNVGFCSLAVQPSTVSLLPRADVVLLLSVWHHWVRLFGFEAASQLLAQIWERSRQVLYFESGQAEIASDFGLPAMKPSPEQWLTGYLAETCPGSTVHALGQSKAFGAGGGEAKNVAYRTLYMVARNLPN